MAPRVIRVRHEAASAENNGYIRGFNNGIAAASRKAGKRNQELKGNDLHANEEEKE